MANDKYDFGMIGLGTMGRNFLLNIADHGYSVIGLDRDPDKADSLEEESQDGRRVKGTTSMEDFVAALEPPRIVMLLVPAGKIVDAVIEDLIPLLEKDDLIIDGGNSHFPNTQRRIEYLEEQGIGFLGAGVSGGAAGARRGPSIMPGGTKAAWERVQPIFEAASAKVNGEPCVTYIGKGASGHYVKMVHNGIEYGMMQLIAEAYDILKNAGGMNNDQLAATFHRWNEGRLRSFLVAITAEIFEQRDHYNDGLLIDYIMDKAKQKGTGKWTSQSAMDLGIPISTIDAAVSMRAISALKNFRLNTSDVLHFPQKDENLLKADLLAEQMEKALYFSFIITYAQGMHLLAEASRQFVFDLDLEGIARIWRGGCIIRADMLEDIRQAFSGDVDMENMIMADQFRDKLMDNQIAIREIVHLAMERGIPVLGLATAIQYFDAFRTGRLPLNLTQAQRDYFGSHTYERTDQEGVFHTDWDEDGIS